MGNLPLISTLLKHHQEYHSCFYFFVILKENNLFETEMKMHHISLWQHLLQCKWSKEQKNVMYDCLTRVCCLVLMILVDESYQIKGRKIFQNLISSWSTYKNFINNDLENEAYSLNPRYWIERISFVSKVTFQETHFI